MSSSSLDTPVAATKPINTYDSVVAATIDKLRHKILEQSEGHPFAKINKAVNGEKVKALLYLPDRIKELELTQQFYVFTFVDKHDKHHVCRLISHGKISYYASDEVTPVMLLDKSEAIIKAGDWSRFEYAHELKDLANKVAAKPYRDKFSQTMFVEAKWPTLLIEDELYKYKSVKWPSWIDDQGIGSALDAEDQADGLAYVKAPVKAPEPKTRPKSVEPEVIGEEPQRLILLGGDNE